MIDGKHFFDQTVENTFRIHHNIQKIETEQGHDYTTGCLLDHPYSKKFYKLIAIVLSK